MLGTSQIWEPLRCQFLIEKVQAVFLILPLSGMPATIMTVTNYLTGSNLGQVLVHSLRGYMGRKRASGSVRLLARIMVVWEAEKDYGGDKGETQVRATRSHILMWVMRHYSLCTSAVTAREDLGHTGDRTFL